TIEPAREVTPTDLRPLFTSLRERSCEATRSPTVRRSAQRHSHALAAALALLACRLALTATTTASDTHARLQVLADLGATLDTGDPTPSLLALRAELDAWPVTTPITLRGLFTPALRPTLLERYLQTAHERLLRPIWQALAADLGERGTHDQLRAYLLLTTNDLSSEPGPLDPVQKDWLLTELPRLADSDTPGELTLLLTTLFEHATAGDLRFPRDHTLVERARARLRALDDDDAVVRAALVAGNAACEPLSLKAITHAQQLSGASELPCSFTRSGWRTVHAQLIRAAEHRDGWILGRPVREHADPARLARLARRYEALYIAAWTDFLAGLRIRRPADLADASRLLAELTGDERPLAQIFAALEHHTRGLQRSSADHPSLTHLLQGLDRPEHSAAIVRAFAPLLNFAASAPDRQAGLDRWHARLVELRDALEAARRDPADLPALHSQLTTALADTHALLQHTDLRRFRPLLSTLLLPPLTALQGELRDHGKLSLTRAYCSEIDAPLRRLVTRYPFVRDAREEIGLDEFTAFFHPETGALRRFRDTQLTALITVHGFEVSANPGPRDEDHPISPAVLAMFSRAAQLGALAFAGGELGLDLDLDLQCNADIGRVHLSLDGATHSYTCGPDHHARMRWPGKAEPRGATLELLGRDGRRETVPGAGPWGLWRLLEKDGLVSPPQDRSHPRLVFRLDLRASRLGTLDLAITPPRTHGATLLFGDGDPDAPLLAPLRAPELLDPPATLFVGLPTCAALETP
ncbi:MAG TPA: ImcF-related family protein, partial [Nannocystis sp.]